MRIVIFLLFTIFFCNIFATDVKEEPVTPPIPMHPGTPFPTNRPRKPCNQMIWFSYDNATQQCEVAFNNDIEYLTLTIEQLPVGFYYTGEISADCTTISVAIPSGYYRITGTTEEGVTYIGEGDIN